MPTNGDNENRGMPWGLKFFTVVISVFAVLAGVIYVFGRASTAQWDRFAEGIRAEGQPLTFEEIEKARRIIPDDQNSALVIDGLIGELDAIEAVTPEQDVFIFARRSSEADFFTGIPRESIEPSRRFHDDHSAVIDEFTVLRDMPVGRFDLKFDGSQSVLEISLPVLSPIRTCSKLLCLRTMLQLIDGQLDDAADTIDLQFAVGAALNEHPTVIGRLVQLAINALAKKSLEDSLRVGELSADAFSKVETAVDLAVENNSIRWALMGERAFLVGTCDGVLDGDISPLHVSPNASGGPMFPFVPTFLIRKNQTKGASILTRLIEKADDPGALETESKLIDKEIGTLPVTQFLTKMIVPSLSRAIILHLRLTAELLCTKTALAAEKYRMATGDLPESLDDLVPDYLDAVPVDPFTGESLLLASTEKGIVIYSVGEDRTDNGGIVTRQKKRPYVLDVGFRLHKPEHRGLKLIDEPEEED